MGYSCPCLYYRLRHNRGHWKKSEGFPPIRNRSPPLLLIHFNHWSPPSFWPALAIIRHLVQTSRLNRPCFNRLFDTSSLFAVVLLALPVRPFHLLQFFYSLRNLPGSSNRRRVPQHERTDLCFGEGRPIAAHSARPSFCLFPAGQSPSGQRWPTDQTQTVGHPITQLEQIAKSSLHSRVCHERLPAQTIPLKKT
jgi:hypothetical protein